MVGTDRNLTRRGSRLLLLLIIIVWIYTTIGLLKVNLSSDGGFVGVVVTSVHERRILPLDVSKEPYLPCTTGCRSNST